MIDAAARMAQMVRAKSLLRASTHFRTLGALAAVVLAAVPAHAIDLWSIGEDFAAFSMADAHWTVDESFPGRKLIFEGRYTVRRETADAPVSDGAGEPVAIPERLLGTFTTELQWGKGETDLEYGVLRFTAYASQRDFSPAPGGLQPLRDTLEWGVLRFIEDEPLGMDSYAELTVARVSRTWGYRRPDSLWSATVGLNVSGGFAWADSHDETFQDVSNPIAGTWIKGTASRRGWGTIYLEQRVVNGWTFSSPDRGGSVSREARARFGYQRGLGSCLNLEVFAEKRSFNFADPRGANLYTKSKRVGIQLACAF